jgi:hypothetical protein
MAVLLRNSLLLAPMHSAPPSHISANSAEVEYENEQ